MFQKVIQPAHALIDDERLKALWVEAEGKPKRFGRLIEAEHGIREYEVEDG